MMPRVIVINKKTFYEFCFLDKEGAVRRQKMRLSRDDIGRFKKMHQAHQSTLKEVKRVLEDQGIVYRVSHRKAHIDYTRYDLIVTVGGDGTFLQAARHVRDQWILGVNSDPQRSVGKFCLANKHNFAQIFNKILNKKIKPSLLSRIMLQHDRLKRTWLILNDVLVCDVNPAAMSRYILKIGNLREEQRSSGLWVSTASGSTGAIHSSGAPSLKRTSRRMLYRPRELYYRFPGQYRLSGHALSAQQNICIQSLMRKGAIYLDGAHSRTSFLYGDTVHISRSKFPVHAFV